MKAHIRWIFFKNEDLGEFIRNDENNENWPDTGTYVDKSDKWWKEIDNQQKEINRLEITNNQTRQLIANVCTWFIKEYNLLGKPARRAWLVKQQELKRLEQELKINQHNLDRPRQEFEEHEERCLLEKIRIGKRKIDNCQKELVEFAKSYEEERKELCHRLTYQRNDLELYTISKTGGSEIKFEQYEFFWKKFHDIQGEELENQPLIELKKCLDEWKTHNRGKDIDSNPYEIWVEEKTDNTLTFVWEPVELELEIVNEVGEIEKKKGVYLTLLKTNYLFNYYGEWYEVMDSQQLNYNTVAVMAQRSIFYNSYRHFVKSQANMIIHHAPKTIASQEICSCPSYEIYTSRRSFELEYELKFDTYRMGKDELRNEYTINDDFLNNMTLTGAPVKVNNELTYINEQFGLSGISGVPSPLAIAQGIKEFVLGKKSFLYLLLNRNLNGGIWYYDYFSCPTSEEEARNISYKKLYFKTVGKYNEIKQTSDLTDYTKEKWLEEKGLLANPMHHFLRTHIKATLFWRKIPIWKGNYWELHNQMMITESASPSGNCVTIEASGRILTRVNELVTAKVGFDTKGILSALITTATTVASAFVPGAGVVGAVASAAISAGVNAVGGMAQLAANNLMSSPSYSETSQTMSINEFRHKILFGKAQPISLELEYNQELANQYLNKRELKGPMLYIYKNFENIGDILTKQPTDPNGYFLKASVISWNMSRDSDWWREKIESGVFIYNKNYLNFYRKSLTGNKIATVQGGIPRSSWNEFSSMKSCGIKGGFDNIADKGGGFYVYKQKGGRPNYIKPRGGSHDFLPDIMNEMKRKYPNFYDVDDTTMWRVKWPEPEFNNERWDVPNNYKNKKLEDGQMACDIEFRLDFFSGGDESLPGERYDITHILVSKTNTGTRSDLIFNFVGEIVRKVRGANPASIPPSIQLPTDPNIANVPPATPFNPNRFPQSGNLTPNPSGGEPEFNVPDIDRTIDIDIPPLDIDTGVDIDNTTDIDRYGPDIDPTDRGDND